GHRLSHGDRHDSERLELERRTATVGHRSADGPTRGESGGDAGMAAELALQPLARHPAAAAAPVSKFINQFIHEEQNERLDQSGCGYICRLAGFGERPGTIRRRIAQAHTETGTGSALPPDRRG